MKFRVIEILLLGLGTIVLALIAVWVREELLEWRDQRQHRGPERRRGPRDRRRF
jgi:hypothetical protein